MQLQPGATSAALLGCPRSPFGVSIYRQCNVADDCQRGPWTHRSTPLQPLSPWWVLEHTLSAELQHPDLPGTKHHLISLQQARAHSRVQVLLVAHPRASAAMPSARMFYLLW